MRTPVGADHQTGGGQTADLEEGKGWGVGLGRGVPTLEGGTRNRLIAARSLFWSNDVL